MSGADLRALADALPRPKDNTGKLPTLPGYFLLNLSCATAAGTLLVRKRMSRLGRPIPAQLIDFSKSPELAIGKYRTSQGEATVTLISYPTPQIARERMEAMQAAALSGGPFYFKRSGPYVIVVSGNIPGDEAQSLLASVNYDADVTLLQPTKPKPVEDRAGFIVALVHVMRDHGAGLPWSLASCLEGFESWPTGSSQIGSSAGQSRLSLSV